MVRLFFVFLGEFALGIVKRSYYWLPALLLDPFDIYNKYIASFGNWEVINMPSEWFPLVFGVMVLWAGFLTYFEVRSKGYASEQIDNGRNARAVIFTQMGICALNDRRNASSQRIAWYFGVDITNTSSRQVSSFRMFLEFLRNGHLKTLRPVMGVPASTLVHPCLVDGRIPGELRLDPKGLKSGTVVFEDDFDPRSLEEDTARDTATILIVDYRNVEYRYPTNDCSKFAVR